MKKVVTLVWHDFTKFLYTDFNVLVLITEGDSQFPFPVIMTTYCTNTSKSFHLSQNKGCACNSTFMQHDKYGSLCTCWRPRIPCCDKPWQENAGYQRNVSSRMLRRPYPCVLPSVFSPFHTAENAYIEGVQTYGKGPQPIMWCGSGAELVKIIIRSKGNGTNYGGIYMGRRGRRQNLRGGCW